MKKTIAKIVLFALFAALLTVGAIADGEPTIVVSSATAENGQAVVTVSLENNPGIAALILGFDYDTSKLELTDIETDTGLGGQWQANQKAVWVGSESTYSGEILTLTFKVLDGASDESVPVTVTYEEGDICNYDLEDVSFAIEDGSVTVPYSAAAAQVEDGDSGESAETAEADETAQPDSGDDARSSVPDNGDETNVVLYAVLALVSMTGLAMLAVRRRKADR